MSRPTTIEHAYHTHDHDLFMAELRRLLDDKARLDYLERLRTRMQRRGGVAWDAFHFLVIPDSPTVREQIDRERDES